MWIFFCSNFQMSILRLLFHLTYVICMLLLHRRYMDKAVHTIVFMSSVFCEKNLREVKKVKTLMSYVLVLIRENDVLRLINSLILLYFTSFELLICGG